MTNRLCADCKHFSIVGDCVRNERSFIEPVHGHMVTVGQLRPRSERAPDKIMDQIARLFGAVRCGPEGRFWEEMKS